MVNEAVPLFPRGFIVSKRPVVPPPAFIPGPILPNFYIHPWTNVESAGDSELFVIILGLYVRTQPDTYPLASTSLLEVLKVSETQFLKSMDEYCGRFVVIFGSIHQIKVVTDATAMRSVFYADDGSLLASHAFLIQEVISTQTRNDDLVFRYGYPGNKTPYDRTRILTPNTYLNLSTNKLHRFWPLRPPAERTVEEVARQLITSVTYVLREVAKTAPVKLALTAGLDSRVLLSLALESGIDFETYTYGYNRATAVDRAFAPDLAHHVGVQHTHVVRGLLSQHLTVNLMKANYSPHHDTAVSGLAHFFDSPQTVAVTGNLLEIGRSFYKRFRDRGFDPPVTSHAMARLHLASMPRSSQNRIADYGTERFYRTAVPAFDSFIEETNFIKAKDIINPFDQFYWEHRMATWHGPALLERDFYGSAFIPFNTRNVFEAMLGVKREDRDRGAIFYKMLELVNPKLLQLPVNPKQWPRENVHPANRT